MFSFLLEILIKLIAWLTKIRILSNISVQNSCNWISSGPQLWFWHTCWTVRKSRFIRKVLLLQTDVCPFMWLNCIVLWKLSWLLSWLCTKWKIFNRGIKITLSPHIHWMAMNHFWYRCGMEDGISFQFQSFNTYLKFYLVQCKSNATEWKGNKLLTWIFLIFL